MHEYYTMCIYLFNIYSQNPRQNKNKVFEELELRFKVIFMFIHLYLHAENVKSRCSERNISKYNFKTKTLKPTLDNLQTPPILHLIVNKGQQMYSKNYKSHTTNND